MNCRQHVIGITLLICAGISPRAALAQCMAVPLQGLQGQAYAQAVAMNANGTVVGQVGGQPAQWDALGRLTLLPHSSGAYATGINAKGHVVGAENFSLPDGSASSRPVKWINGVLTPLDMGKAWAGIAMDINDLGEVIGNLYVAGDSAGRSSVRWTATGVRQILRGTSANTEEVARRLNGSGTVVGAVGAGSSYQGATWSRSNSPSILSAAGYTFVDAWAINASGMSVGGAIPRGAVEPVPVSWKSQCAPARLPIPVGYSGTAFDVNDRGVIVGQVSLASDIKGVAWSKGAMVDLNQRLPLSFTSQGHWVDAALRVNSSGMILASYRRGDDGLTDSVLLKSCLP